MDSVWFVNFFDSVKIYYDRIQFKYTHIYSYLYIQTHMSSIVHMLISVKIMSVSTYKENVSEVIATIDNCIDLLQDNLTLGFVYT